MRKLLFLLLLCGPTSAVWSQSRPVMPATLVVETKELMALQDSVRLHRMARREAEHQRDSLLAVVAEWRSTQPTGSAPKRSEPLAARQKTGESQSDAQAALMQQKPRSAQPTAASSGPKKTPENSDFWVVVGGSSNAAVAAEMAKTYSRPPFQAVVVQAPSGIHRVCWGPFADEKTALEVLRDARKIRPDAWFWRPID